MKIRLMLILMLLLGGDATQAADDKRKVLVQVLNSQELHLPPWVEVPCNNLRIGVQSALKEHLSLEKQELVSKDNLSFSVRIGGGPLKILQEKDDSWIEWLPEVCLLVKFRKLTIQREQDPELECVIL